jgi:hypothetical protein
LKGHLLIEEALTGILELHVFHPEHLEAARLSFHHKACIVRALGLRKDKFGEWDLLQAINTLRNDLAHQLHSDQREKKVQRLREVYLREAKGMEGIEELRDADEVTLLVNAMAHMVGFLSAMHADSKALRGFVHALDRSMNPDLPAFDP